MHPGTIDWDMVGVYFAFLPGVGFTLWRYTKTSTGYFVSGRSIAAWAAELAFLPSNPGAQEVMGMPASGVERPVILGACVLAGASLLNLLFW